MPAGAGSDEHPSSRAGLRPRAFADPVHVPARPRSGQEGCCPRRGDDGGFTRNADRACPVADGDDARGNVTMPEHVMGEDTIVNLQEWLKDRRNRLHWLMPEMGGRRVTILDDPRDGSVDRASGGPLADPRPDRKAMSEDRWVSAAPACDILV